MKISPHLVFSDGASLVWGIKEKRILNGEKPFSSYRAVLFSMNDIIVNITVFGILKHLRIQGPMDMGFLMDSLDTFFCTSISKEDYDTIMITNVRSLFDQRRSDFKKEYKTYGDLLGKDMVVSCLRKHIFSLSNVYGLVVRPIVM